MPYKTIQLDTSTANTLKFDSTTLVINESTNRVGIGTATPAFTLDVQGNVFANTRVYTPQVQATGSVGLGLFDDSGANGIKIADGGNVGIGTTSPSTKLHVNGDTYLVGNVGVNLATASVALDINGDSLRIRTAKTPASASASGHQGQISWDADYLYVCTATDTWKRVAIAW